MTKTSSCDEREHPDGCLCHAPVADHEATADHELPAATGGVQGDRKPRKPRRPAAEEKA
jgi:hypothetical protein